MLFFFYLAIARTIQVSFLTPHTYHYIIPQTQLSGLEWDDLAKINNERKRKKGIKLKEKKGRMTRESKSHGGKRRGKGKRKKGQRGFLSSVEDLRVLHFHHLHLCHHLHYLPHHDHPLQWRGCWWLSCTLKIMGSIQRIDSQHDIVWRYPLLAHTDKGWRVWVCFGKWNLKACLPLRVEIWELKASIEDMHEDMWPLFSSPLHSFVNFISSLHLHGLWHLLYGKH